MSESALALGYPEYLIRVAEFLSYDSAPTGNDLAKCQRYIDTGYRDFLKAEGQHDWSFLHPTATITTVSGTAAYDLPDDYGSPDSSFTYDTSLGFHPITIIAEHQIRMMKSGTTSLTSYPIHAAIRAKTSDGTDGQRSEVEFFPVPAGIYILGYAYNVLAGIRLRTGTPYPLGGMHHADTVEEAILAAAERGEDDTIGIHATRFKEALQASIVADRKRTPDFSLYNRDLSDGPSEGRARNSWIAHSGLQGVTINGSSSW